MLHLAMMMYANDENRAIPDSTLYEDDDKVCSC